MNELGISKTTYYSTTGSPLTLSDFPLAVHEQVVFSIDKQKFVDQDLYGPCLTIVSLVITLNIKALVLYTAIYHFMSHRGTSLQVLQVSANLAFRLEWVRKLALTEFKAGLVCVLASLAVYAWGSAPEIGSAITVICGACIVLTTGLYVWLGRMQRHFYLEHLGQ